MVIYICRRCDYTTNRKSNLVHHLENRKKKCELLTNNSIYQFYTTRMLIENAEMGKEEVVTMKKALKDICSDKSNAYPEDTGLKEPYLKESNYSDILKNELGTCSEKNVDNWCIKTDNLFYCKICYKEFSSKFNVQRHSEKCLKKNEASKRNQDILEVSVLENNIIKNILEETVHQNMFHQNNSNNLNNTNNINNINNINNTQNNYQNTFIDKSININNNNNITINLQIVPFDGNWDLSKISNDRKRKIITNNNLYTSLLTEILENEKNLNVILSNDADIGMIYANEKVKYKVASRDDIIMQSMLKLRNQLMSISNEECVGHEISNDNLNSAVKRLDEKFQNFINCAETNFIVNKYFTEIFDSKKEKSIQAYHGLMDENNEIGF